MDVFLSYARSASRAYVEALYRELGGDAAGLAFLDTEEIEHGDHFPQRLINALLASRIVVIFAEPVYFTRWYCILEFRAARAPFAYLAESAGTTPEDRAKALESVLIVLPPDGARSLDMWNLPPALQQIDWPTVSDPVAIAAQIRSRLTIALPTLAERIERTVGVDRFRREWLNVTRLPPPERIPAGTLFVPARGLPLSLHERFVGRADDLWRIHDTLTTRLGGSQSAATLTCAIEGGAGVGKSRLALEYLYRFGPRYYPGGLFWIDAERTLDSQYYQVICALNPTTPDWKTVQSEPGGVGDRLVSEFQALPLEKPALVVVDNIPEPQPGEPPRSLYEWFPAVGYVRLLVTSRSRVSLSSGAVVPLPIDVLDVGAGQALLTRDIDFHAIEAAGWCEIVKWVGSLPLALELLNSALYFHAFTAADLMTRARSVDTTAVLDKAMDALRAVVPAGSLRGATEALAYSYERLPEQAKVAARLIAWLAPAPIPEVLLQVLSEDQFDPMIVIPLLVNRSFVNGTPGATGPMLVSMHRVLADFLRTKSEDHLGELTHLTKALLEVMGPEQVLTPSKWPLMDVCEPHAATLLNHVSTQQPRIEFVDHTAMLALVLVELFLAQGFSAEASDLALGALIACAEETEPGQFAVPAGRPAVREFTRRLPRALAQNGEYDAAIQLQRIYLGLLQQERGEGDRQMLTESDNLADMLRQRGHAEDLEEAHRILEQTVQAWQQRDTASRDTLTALNNLALVEQRRGDMARAVSLFEEVLNGLQHLENVQMETIQTMQSLANSLWETDPEHAYALLNDALVIADRIQLPDHHPVMLNMLTQLGSTAQKRGDDKQVQVLLRRTVPVLAATRGEHDSETTIHAWVLWDAQFRTGNTTIAAETRSRYLDWLREADNEQLTPEQQNIRADVLQRIGS